MSPTCPALSPHEMVRAFNAQVRRHAHTIELFHPTNISAHTSKPCPYPCRHELLEEMDPFMVGGETTGADGGP